jgi:hypothetical protein
VIVRTWGAACCAPTKLPMLSLVHDVSMRSLHLSGFRYTRCFKIQFSSSFSSGNRLGLGDEAGDAGIHYGIEALAGLNAIDFVEGVLG